MFKKKTLNEMWYIVRPTQRLCGPLLKRCVSDTLIRCLSSKEWHDYVEGFIFHISPRHFSDTSLVFKMSLLLVEIHRRPRKCIDLMYYYD